MDVDAYKRTFAPKSVAAIGASPVKTSFGGRLLASLESNGYAGTVYPVNPKYDEINGLTCYPSVDAIPGDVDAAILMVSNERVMATLESCATKSCRLAVLFGAGYAETGAEGELAQDALGALSERTGMRILGPNCVGYINIWDRLPASPAGVVDPPKLRQGGISIVAQSGYLGAEMIFGRGYDAGFGFRYVFTTGNEADLEAGELMCFLAQDPETSVIVAYLEGVRDPAALRRAGALAREAGKPIILLKSGRSPEGERSALSHTAALAVSDAVLDAVCEAEGIIRVDDMDDLWELAGILSTGVRIGGRRIAVVGTSGGINTIVADDLNTHGMELPPLHETTVAKLAEILPWYGSTVNPVDLTGYFTGAGRQEVYSQVARLIASDPGIDAVIFSVQADRPTPWDQVIPDLVNQLETADKPIIVLSGGPSQAREALKVLQGSKVPVYWSPERCARGLRLLADFDALQSGKRPAASAPSAGPLVDGLADGVPRWQAERELLAEYGIATVATTVVQSAQEALDAASAVGYPVVLKGLAPGLAHKSDRGLVRVSLADAEALTAAFEDVDALLDEADGAIVVQPMLQGGVEVIVGIQNDPDFGPVVMVGAGGILVELLDDQRLVMPPMTLEQATETVQSLRVARLLRGFRGSEPYDIEALAEVLVNVSNLAAAVGPGISGIDLNPVIVLPKGQGVVAVDWVVHLEPAVEAVS